MNVLAILPDTNPPNTYNVVLPLRHLQQQGALTFIMAYEYTVTPAQVVSADVIVAARNVEPAYRPVFELAIERGIPILYVLDDWLLGVPEDDESIHYYGTPARRDGCIWMLRHADWVRAHSPHLRDLLRPYTERVGMARAAIDWAHIPPTLPELGERVEIVYATGRQHDRLIAPVLPDIRRILADYAGRVRVHFITYHPPALRGVPGVVFVPNEPDYVAFMAAFTRAGYGIGLAPMRRDDFHLAKTNAKFRDYAAAGAAGIYTDCALYAGEGGVTHDQTGLLVGDEAGAWYAAMRALIEDRPRLERIRRAARAYAQQHYTMEAFAAAWLDDLRAVARPIPDRRPPEIERWWFTRSARRAPASWVRWYRGALPARWRVALRDWRLRLRGVVRHEGR